jgi:pilus assembly protein Flp/PilA
MDNLYHREQGQGLVEYALILMFVAMAVIAILTLLGPRIAVSYARIMGGFSGQSVTMSGGEVIVVGANISMADSGGGFCNLSITGSSLIGLQDGEIITNQGITAQVKVNGINVPGATLSATANANGVAALSSSTVSASGVDCGQVSFALVP